MSGRVTKALIQEIVNAAIKKKLAKAREKTRDAEHLLAMQVRAELAGGADVAAKIDGICDQLKKLYGQLPCETRYVIPYRTIGSISACGGTLCFLNHQYQLPRDSLLSDQTAKEVKAHLALRAEHDATAARIRTELEAALGKFTTVKKLLAEWPEIEELLPAGCTEKKALPMVPVQKINDLLGLPSEEKAA